MQLRWLSNEDLHTDLQSTCSDHRKGLVDILRYLSEVDRRRLYATMGYRSLFAYCIKALKMSENEAGPRVAVARLAKEYPWVLEALAEGDVHLTGLSRLSAYMDSSNCLDLLEAARGKTVKEIDDLMAVRFPRPDVPELLRALPLRAPKSAPQALVESPRKSSAAERTIPMFDEKVLGSALQPPSVDGPPTAGSVLARNPVILPVVSNMTPSACLSSIAQRETLPTRSRRVQRKETLKALSARRHALQLTVSTELRRKLERARDLMTHRNPGGTFEAIVGVAVDLLLTKLERERLGKTARKTSRPMPPGLSSDTIEAEASASAASSPVTPEPAPSEALQGSSDTLIEREPGPTSGRSTSPTRLAAGPSKQVKRRTTSRSIPRAVRREVFERDGEQCSFVSKAGVRCGARSFLEVDHVHPKALGGDDTVANTRLLCATHNRHAAEERFGRDYVQKKIRQSQEARRQR